YSVVYEFSNGALSDARLVKGDQTIGGRLVAAAEQEKLNEAVQQGAITLRRPEATEAPKVHNVACFEDGRYLVQLLNKAELYLGTPGNYAKLDATLTVQGGGSRFYTLPDGEEINLPYG